MKLRTRLLTLLFALGLSASAFAATKPSLNFTFLFTGDGATNSITIDTSTGPMFYGGATSSDLLNPLLNTILPSAVHNASCPGFSIVSATLGGVLTKQITITFTGTPPANGTTYQCSGILDF